MNQIDHQVIVDCKGGQALPPDLLEEVEELGILDLAVECEPDGMGVRAGEVGQPLALADALAIDEVDED